MSHPNAPAADVENVNVKSQHDVAVQELCFDSAIEQDAAQNNHVDPTAQAGVQQVEAIAIVWSRTSRALVYLFIWIVYFVVLMQQSVSASLLPYVASAYQEHSLTPTISVVSSIVGGVCCLPAAKMIDIFGRPQGYAFCLFITTIGLVMMAATSSVQMYAAALVFWTVGNNTLLYTVNIFIADTTKLHNRVLVTWLAASPNIFTSWIGGPMAEAFLKGLGWHWYYGIFSIVVLVTCLPLFIVLWTNERKAKKQGIVISTPSEGSAWESLLHYCREFDAIGLTLLIAGLAMLLLPFNIYALQPQGWNSPLIICLLVYGVVLLVLFAVWERFWASTEFIPFSLLLDRNVVGSSILGTVLFISYYCWSSFFTSFLQVVYDLTITEAGYVAQIYGVGGNVAGVAVGYLIHRTGFYKSLVLYGALPVYTLFMGLLIHFRTAETGFGYIIMCLVFVAFASGAIMAISPLPAMAAAAHRHVAVVVAIVSMFSSIGGAVGLTVASVIWGNVFPAKLLEYLPAENQAELADIFGNLQVQLGYPLGSPARIAIQHAYSDGQQVMMIVGTAVWFGAFVSVALWRNTDLRTLEQVRGYVI
ncbi:MFS siderochrome iron transporter 1 [Colletotrichum sidae]|uniref:MFS siderochrome iron transporter 1 n=1 Tax=Colletotrichum sidae TaxID=1347389 RepID=A0A4R8TKH6_9PEZI|nr:MFS siderochrome iron transporter 1 [Colletotrichum sidae]